MLVIEKFLVDCSEAVNKRYTRYEDGSKNVRIVGHKLYLCHCAFTKAVDVFLF